MLGYGTLDSKDKEVYSLQVVREHLEFLKDFVSKKETNRHFNVVMRLIHFIVPLLSTFVDFDALTHSDCSL